MFIPVFCVFQALKARSVNRFHDEAWHLLKACQWNESHAIILTHIAADAIINGTNLDLLASVSLLLLVCATLLYFKIIIKFQLFLCTLSKRVFLVGFQQHFCWWFS